VVAAEKGGEALRNVRLRNCGTYDYLSSEYILVSIVHHGNAAKRAALRPTLRDVAREAGVSPITVSRVVNRERLVSPNTAAKVKEAILRLGYEPNEMARSLRERRSRTIGLMIADISNPFYAECAKAVEEVAREKGYSVVLCASAESAEIEREYVGLLARGRVDGLLLVPASSGRGYLKEERYAGLPMVALDRPIEDVATDTVLVKNREGTREAVRHLVGHGHHSVAFVGGHEHLYTVRKRLEGYREAVREANLQEILCFGAVDVASSARMVANLLHAPSRPSAIFAWNNLAALGALRAIEERGMDVPEEVALVGFDDSDWAALLHPRLTLVRQPAYELGRQAAELLFERLQSTDMLAPRTVVLPTELVVRESCGCTHVLQQ
jgi:LacI family transcriptional regulator